MASRAGTPRSALDPGVSLHLYGKRTPGAGRKMGHLTVLDPDPETALDRAWRRDTPWSPAENEALDILYYSGSL